MLNCEGIEEWETFFKAVVPYAHAGFPYDTDMLAQAWILTEKWSSKSYPPQEFHAYLCDQSEQPWPPKEGFCLYGYIMAMFIRGRHLMMEDEKDYKALANQDFHYGVTCLGREGSTDFLDSSAWPLNILDLYLNIDINSKDFMTYKEYNKKYPVPPPFQSEQPNYELYEGPKKDLDLAIFGTHATLSLEPTYMLREFGNHKNVFYGLEQRWCEIVKICETTNQAELFADLFKKVNNAPYDYPWDVMEAAVNSYTLADPFLLHADLIVCTEPVIGCIMVQRAIKKARGGTGHEPGGQRIIPILAYLGVALLNTVPPPALQAFWHAWDQVERIEIAVNNRILKEQIYYQTGVVVPYIRPHGLYTKMLYQASKDREVLFWRAPLFLYPTFRCALVQFLREMEKSDDELLNQYPLAITFMEADELMKYEEVQEYRSIILLPWDHALMTFYELYQASMPMFLPHKEWMYRILYQRGQLSVGEPIYQSLHPHHSPPQAQYANVTVKGQEGGAISMESGLSAAKAARGIAEDMLVRGLSATTMDEQTQYAHSALELIQDMYYFLAAADNKTDVDSYTSRGKVSRQSFAGSNFPSPTEANRNFKQEEWHPYTPFQISPDDSNEWTRMRKSGWWLRRGVRFDAMRYWYQFSDFHLFPGIEYFESIPDMLCKLLTADNVDMAERMNKYNVETFKTSRAFWGQAMNKLAI